MTRSTSRLLRAALVLVVLAMAGAVGWTLRRRAPAASPTEPPEPTAEAAGPVPAVTAGSGAPIAVSPPPQKTRMDDLVYRNVKGGRETFVIRAKKMSGREQEQMKLETVTLEFGFVLQGKPGRGVIVADECIYFPTRQEAFFQGHVKLTTDEGATLESEQLVYSGEQQKAHSDYPVRFTKRGLSGRGKRMEYAASDGRVDLIGDVLVRLDEQRDGAVEVTSERAQFRLVVGEAQFDDDVKLMRGGDTLMAGSLLLVGGDDELKRVHAQGEVLVVSTSGALPGLGPRKKGPVRRTGPRELRCQIFDLALRPNRTLEEAVAANDAVLVMRPGPDETREKRTLKGSVLTFRWDEQERLQELLGQKDTEFRAEPLPPSKAPARSVKSRNFTAQMDPVSGAIKVAEFNKDVEFVRGTQRATAGRGSFSGADSLLALRDDPSLADSEQNTRLEAEVLDLFTQSGDVRARLGVRHTLSGKQAAGAMPGASEEGALVTSRLFDYDAKTKSARYQEGALLRSGKSELRATEIKRTELASGARLVEASGDVVSRIVPQPVPGEPDKPTLETRSKEMSYDEAKRKLVYRGDTQLVQGDLRTKSPEATITLTQGGSEVERLEAGDPVELVSGARKATGQRAVYTPGAKSILITGDKAEMKEDKQQVQGRSLTFFVGDDRILVDGREEARTETIFRKKP